jgi:hypothetical protein
MMFIPVRRPVNPETGWPYKPHLRLSQRQMWLWECTDNHRYHGYGDTPVEAYAHWYRKSGGPSKKKWNGLACLP